jgi:glycine/D-amino acid oxidase-like deaminating enzyme
LEGSRQADVCIVGGGFLGLSTALHLAEAACDVVLLEAAEPGWGASGRNGGQIIPGFKAERTEIIRVLGQKRGERLFKWSGQFADFTLQLIQRHNIDCHASQPGWIQPAHSLKSLKAYQSRAEAWQAQGAPVEMVDAREAERLLGTAWYKGAYIDRRGGRLHPLSYSRGLARAAQKVGANIHGETPVREVYRGARKWVVKSDGGAVEADHVVLCTNAYSDMIGSGGIWPGLACSIIPIQSYMIATRPLSENLRRTILPEGQTAADLKRLTNHFRIEPDGRLLLGGRGSLVEGEGRRGYAPLIAKLHQFFPHLGDIAIDYLWSGKVALTVDHVPHVHRLGPGLIAALGCNGRGVGMASNMAKIMADLVLGGPDEASPIPITSMRTILFHRFRLPAMQAAVWWKGLQDRIEHRAGGL